MKSSCLAGLFGGFLNLSLAVPALADGVSSSNQDIPGDRQFPEGIALHDGTGDIFLGGAGNASIQRLRNGVFSWFRPPGSDGMQNPIGMAVDSRRNRLWVCNSDVHAPYDLPEVLIYDTQTTNLLARFPVPADGGNHFLNDVCVGADGRAYLTDSLAPIIWTVDPALTTLSKFVEDPVELTQHSGFNLNGLILTEDESLLLATIPGNNGGLWRIDMGTLVIQKVAINNFTGGDGLVWGPSGELYCISSPIVRIVGDSTWSSAARRRLNEFNGLLDGPTTAVVREDRLIVSNAQIPHLVGSASGPPNLPFDLLSLPLEQTCYGNCEPGTAYFSSTVNSTGNPALMRATGFESVSTNQLRLEAMPVPAGELGVFSMGTMTANTPFAGRVLCVGGSVSQSAMVLADSSCRMRWEMDLTSMGSIQAGVTRHFQVLYRDLLDPDAIGFNVSDGYTVLFTQ